MTASPSLLNEMLVRERARPGPRRPTSMRLVRPSPLRAVRRRATRAAVRGAAAAAR